jgi:hypothetical protein
MSQQKADKTNQHGSRPACTFAQSDQDPCCFLTNPFTSRETDGKQHGSWISLQKCAGWSGSMLVANALCCFVMMLLIYTICFFVIIYDSFYSIKGNKSHLGMYVGNIIFSSICISFVQMFKEQIKFVFIFFHFCFWQHHFFNLLINANRNFRKISLSSWIYPDLF